MISSNIRSLFLYDFGTIMEETDLKQLSICQHIYKLFLHGDISNLPEHNVFPPNLTKLTLILCSQLKQDPTPILERLPNLGVLHLLPIEYYIGEEMVFSSNGFARLKHLKLFSEFLKRLRVDMGAMHKRRSLERVPEGVRHIKTLQSLEIHNMPKDFIPRLQLIDGKGVLDVNSVFEIKNTKFITGFKKMTKLVFYDGQLFVLVLNDGPLIWQFFKFNSRCCERRSLTSH